MFMYRLIPVGRLLIIATMLICLAFGQSTFAHTVMKACAAGVRDIRTLEVISPAVGVVVADSFSETAVSQLILNNHSALMSKTAQKGNSYGIGLPPGEYSIHIYKPNGGGPFPYPISVLHNISSPIDEDFTITLESNWTEQWKDSGTYRISIIPQAVPDRSPCVEAEAFIEIEMIGPPSPPPGPKPVAPLLKSGWRSIRTG